MVVAGSSLLLSAAESKALVDGAIEWSVQSPLRAVVALLCLNYRFPTINAGDVKVYVLGFGAGLALLAVTYSIAVRPRIEEWESTDDPEASESNGTDRAPHRSPTGKAHIPPLAAAQLLVGLYLLWSLASSRWSAAPELAIGGSILLAIHFLWAFVLRHGLNLAAARAACSIIIVITGLTAIAAIWYYYGRNPTLRAKFPFGNPNFLAACLIPGILLPLSLAGHGLADALRGHRPPVVRTLLLPGAVAALAAWTLYLTGSRGPAVGLVFGLLSIWFFCVHGRHRFVPVAAGAGVLVCTWFLFAALQGTASPAGRDATIRFRLYAWSYAWQMFQERPVTGHGQGGFVLGGDARTIDDVLRDPTVFESRIEHAHNEWLEVLADLGAVGLVLIASALLLTIRAAMLAMAARPPSDHRWALRGLLGALVGMVVGESFGVGLRVSDVPAMFYTVLGLIWALSGPSPSATASWLALTRPRRIGTGVVGTVVGLATMLMTQQDFAAAGNAFRSEEQLALGNDEEAIRWAEAAGGRLSPHRALINLYRLSEAHMSAAKRLQDRAIEREARAARDEPPNPSLVALAQSDRQASDEHAKLGSHALKELVARSPGYLNHGWVEYLLNMIQADNAVARNDRREADLRARNAAAAIERELSRQPFDPWMAVSYAEVARGSLDPAELIEVLARPLRYKGGGREYAGLLAELAGTPGFTEAMASAAREAQAAVMLPTSENYPVDAGQRWAPEKLRLAAMLHFQRGDYDGARELLERAAMGYDRLPPSAAIGAASCNAELAECRFYSEPREAVSALVAASRAIALAPASEAGKALVIAVKQRMIDYFLAGDDEESARRLLVATGPSTVSDAVIDGELGLRYRRMLESLLLRRRDAWFLPKSAGDLVPHLQRWAGRAIALNPRDHLSHYLAADLAFHGGDEEAAALHLRQALEAGLSPADACRFLSVAREKKPNSPALESLWKDIQANCAAPPSAPQ